MTCRAAHNVAAPYMASMIRERGCPIICVWNQHELTREETNQGPCMQCLFPVDMQALRNAVMEDFTP